MTSTKDTVPLVAARGRAATNAERPIIERGGLGVMTVYLVFLFAIPSRLIVAPLGSAGTPAQIVSLGLGLSWLAARIYRGVSSRSRIEPVRISFLIFFAALVLSYVAAQVRGLSSPESNGADTAQLLALGWLGLILFTGELTDKDTLIAVLHRLVVAAGALASLGVLQFATRQAFTNYITIPGLVTNNALDSITDRSGFARPAGTAIHPIEFGAVITMVLPIAIHFAMTETSRSAFRRWYPVAAIAAAIPISISRSAIISTVVVLAFLLPTWSVVQRRRTYGAIVVLMALVFASVPGLLGTITGLFTGISGDSSALSRSDSYNIAEQFIAQSPFIGRGFGTFLPAYHILDNQYLGLFIETGALGLLSFLGVMMTGIVVAWRIRSRSSDISTRSLGQALAASVASAAVSFALFDGFSFPMASSVLFLILGSISAFNRLERAPA